MFLKLTACQKIMYFNQRKNYAPGELGDRYRVLPWMPKVLSALELIRAGEISARKAATNNNSEVRYLVERGHVMIKDSTDIPRIVMEPTKRDFEEMRTQLEKEREPHKSMWR